MRWCACGKHQGSAAGGGIFLLLLFLFASRGHSEDEQRYTSIPPHVGMQIAQR